MHLRLLVPALAVVALSCSDPTAPAENEILSVVSGNGFSCALVGETVQCWGRNDLGQMGRGTVGDDAAPGPVSGNHRFKLLGASDRTVCGVTVEDAVLCWGHGRIMGVTTGVASPTLITGNFPASIASLGVGYAHGCVTTSAGAVTCFGTNSLGELGNGNTEPSTGALGATTVIGGHSFSQLSVGAFHTCGVEGGDVWCWGSNFALALGPGTTANAAYSTPVPVTLGFDAARVEAGSAITCALEATSQTWCWGNNLVGQLGRGAGSASSSSATPALVSQVSAYASIALSRLNSTVSHACGVVAAGIAYCWGAGEGSQLGRATSENCGAGSGLVECSAVPAPISSALAFKHVAPGRDHTCGLTTDDAVYCWGSNARGQLGGTTSGTTITAVQVTIAR